MKSRDGEEALGDFWMANVNPLDTASSESASKRGKCWAAYTLSTKDCEQRLTVNWNGKGGGTIHLLTEFEQPPDPWEQEEGLLNTYLSHGIEGSFDKTGRRRVKEEWLRGETERVESSPSW